MQRMPAAVIIAALASAAAALAPLRVSAQSLWPVSIEAGVGIGVGHATVRYRENNVGLSAAALIAARVRRLGSGGLTLAAAFTAHAGGPVTDICILDDKGGCVPGWPRFDMLSLLAGWETARGGARVMAGPARVRIDFDEWETALQARLDAAALPVLPHFALMLSLRTTFIPSRRNAALLLYSLGFGFRIR